MNGFNPLFWLYFVFGFVVLLVEARRLFNDPELGMVLTKRQFRRLEKVSYKDLANEKYYNRGFYVYIAAYLVVYVVAVFSVEVGTVLSNAALTGNQTGYQGPSGPGDAAEAGGAAWPLVIAMAMTFFLSARNQAGRYTRAVESSLRDFAHRLAGVPNSIFRLVTRLGRIDYGQALERSARPYLDMYCDALDRVPEIDRSQAITWRFLENAKKDFEAIDAFEPAICGAFESRIFPVSATQRTPTMVRLINEQAGECSALREMLEDVLNTDNPAPGMDQLRAVAEAGQDCLRNLKALFAVLYSQTDPDDISRNIYTPIDRVFEELRTPDRFGLKDKVLISFFISTIAFIFLYPLWRFNNLRLREEQILSLPDFMAKSFDALGNADVALHETDIYFVLQRAIEDLGPLAVLFLLASVATLSVRRNMIDSGDWKPWTLVNIPVARLVTVVLLPAIVAAVGASAVTLALKLVAALDSSSFMQDSSLFQRVEVAVSVAVDEVLLSVLFYFILYIVLGMIIGFATMVVADQHLNWPMWKTVAWASFFAPFFMLVALIGQFWLAILLVSSNISSGFFFSLLTNGVFQGLFALAYLSVFALLVEISEDPDQSDFERELDWDPTGLGADKAIALRNA